MTVKAQPILAHVQRLAHGSEEISDRTLLGKFLAGDGEAFAQLVGRYGPMVLAVCKRLTGDTRCDDAFQATFLALSRRAKSLKGTDSLAGWLHAVARNAARKVIRDEARHRASSSLKETTANTPSPPDELSARELLAVLDEEVTRLPDVYRLPLLLCFWQGLTQEQAAARLGWSAGSVKGRLERGRGRLANRLSRRGYGLNALLLVPVGAAEVSADLQAATAKLPAGNASASLVRLAASLTSQSTFRKPAVLLFVGSVLIATVAAAGSLGRRPVEAVDDAKPLATPTAAQTDIYGDPLPPGAVGRLGTMQMRSGDTTLLPDGRTVVIAARNGVLRWWDIGTGKLVQTKAIGDSSRFTDSIIISSDGKTLATLNFGVWTFWDVESSTPVETWTQPKANWQYPVYWDGQLFAVFRNDDFRVLTWDRQLGKERSYTFPRILQEFDSSVHALISPDRKWLVGLGGQDEVFGIVDLATCELRQRLAVKHATTSVFTADSKQLIVCDVELRPGNNPQANRRPFSTIRFFDVLTGREIRHLRPIEDYFYSLSLSPDGKKLACCFSDNSVVLDADSGRTINGFQGRPAGARWTPDGRTLILDFGYRLRIWNTADWTERFPRPGDLDSTPVGAVSPDGKLFASGGWMAQTITLWDLNSQRIVRELPLKGDERYVRGLNFSDKGRVLTASQANGYHQWWDVGTGQLLGESDLRTKSRFPRDLVGSYVTQDKKRVVEMETYPDGREKNTRITVRDSATGRVLQAGDFIGESRQAIWYENGSEFIAAFPKSGLKRLRVSDAAILWQAASAQPGFVASTPNGELVAARKQSPVEENPSAVGVWESATGTEVASIKLNRADHFALSADCRRLVTTDVDSVHVWDLASENELLRYALPDAYLERYPHGTMGDGNRTAVRGLALTPDGRRAVTTMRDGTGLVWDIDARANSDRAVMTAAEKDLEKYWSDLGSDNGRVAYAAVWRLSETRTDSLVAFVRKKLHPIAPADPVLVAKWIEKLDDSKYSVREQASRELESLGWLAFPALRTILSTNTSAEVRRRANALLSKIRPMNSADLQGIRAVHILVRVGTDEARQILNDLTRGVVDHPVTRAAQSGVDGSSSR
jgi:RNA polymerase sigma factor (sigma-70 family)